MLNGMKDKTSVLNEVLQMYASTTDPILKVLILTIHAILTETLYFVLQGAALLKRMKMS